MHAARLFRPVALLAVCFLFVAAEVQAQTLRGSRASVERIHRQALSHGLHFYETPAAVRQGVADGRLVPLRGNADYGLAGVSYPYAIPAAVLFVERLASQYRNACGERLIVTSAMRPRSFRLSNSSDKSVHPAGMAIDLRRPTNQRCLAWLRRTLLHLEGAGVLEVVEERNPPHFHVAVFPNPYTRYAGARGPETRVAAARPPSSAAARQAPARQAAGGTTYRVRRGDSLWGIARRHGSTVDEIKQANGIRSTRIVAGQVLVIPQAR